MTTKEQVSKDEISLKEIIEKCKVVYAYLVSKWKIIFLAGLVGGLLGLAYSWTQKPTYTASLSFALEESSNSGGGVLNLASQFGFDLGTNGGGAFTGANLIELFLSRKMIEKTLLSPVKYKGKNISLADMYIDFNNYRNSWEKDPKLRNINFSPETNRKSFTRVQDSVLGSIYSNISKGNLTVAQKDKKVDIISIDVLSGNELFSKFFCESLAYEVSEFYIETKSKKAKINVEILQQQTDSVRTALNSAITGVAVATDNTFNLNPALNVRRTPSARRQVDVQANTAILTEIVKQLELAKVTFRKETPLIQIIDSPILPLKIEKVGKLKSFIIGSILVTFLMFVILIVRRFFNSLN